MRKMRWAALFVTLAAASLAYWTWPIATAVRIGKLGESGAVEALVAYVDFPALRWSLAHQIVRAYLRHSAKFGKLDPVEKGVALATATTAANSLLESTLTPNNVVALLEHGRFAEGPEAEFGEMPRFAELLRHPTFDMIISSYFAGPRSFVIVVGSGDNAYGVRLHLSGLRWFLSGLDLPRAMSDRLAQRQMEKFNKVKQPKRAPD